MSVFRFRISLFSYPVVSYKEKIRNITKKWSWIRRSLLLYRNLSTQKYSGITEISLWDLFISKYRIWALRISLSLILSLFLFPSNFEPFGYGSRARPILVQQIHRFFFYQNTYFHLSLRYSSDFQDFSLKLFL